MSGLPGDLRRLPAGSTHTCETPGHQNYCATYSLQGETDSFGAEYRYLCNECAKKIPRHWYIGTCESCRATNVKLYGYRDWEEGSAARVQALCQPCKSKRVREDNERAAQDYRF